MKSLADPTRLRPTDKKNVFFQVILAPRRSPNKFAFDPEQGIFTLKTVLPAVMTFPYDFGFLARTLGGKGDPMDVLLIMDEPVFPGIASRAIHRRHLRPWNSLFAAADSRVRADQNNVASGMTSPSF
jgi:inorganic pyrophosphatase